MGSWRGRWLTALGLALIAVLGFVGCSSDTSDTGATDETAETDQADHRSEAVDQAVAAYFDRPSTAAASAVVDSMGADDHPVWVPWLVDLLRANLSSGVSQQAQAALAQITEVASTGERIADLNLYGSLIADTKAQGGHGYREWKASLFAQFDAEFGPLLTSVVDDHELAAMQWGGVPRGGIPELNFVDRFPAAEADWMFDDEVVFGVALGGETIAYPLRVIARHELINDTVGDTPVSLVYCTLCRSAILYDRRVAGQTVEFETSGLLLNSNKVMVDRETDTLWSHLRGVGIGGALVEEELTQLIHDTIRWSDWVALHPDTTVIGLPRPIFFDDPERPPIAYDYTPGEAYSFYYNSPDLWFPAASAPDTFEPKTEVVGIEHNGDSVALPLAELAARAATATEPTIVEVGGDDFRIESTGVSVQVFDSEGERVVVEQSFWFAWFANHPDTRALR